jgi:hypothetical protein
MTDCAESVEITMRAAVLDVTPETEEDDAGRRGRRDRRRGTAADGPDPELVAAGETVFAPAPRATKSDEGRATAWVPR